jgi:hypothetical protein
MRKAMCVGLLVLGCSDGERLDLGNDGPEEHGTAQQAVTWSPGGSIVQQHVDWHSAGCSTNGQPLTGQVGVGRRCSRPGEDFLIWHRAFIDRLRDDFEAQGLTHDITPWYTVPNEIRSHSLWTSAQQAGIDAMSSMINPQTGQRFATLDEFGTFIEGSYHGRLHEISFQLWPNTDAVIRGFMSPASTIFFKIHGLVEFHTRRFLQGDFNWDGRSDLFVRNRHASGANSGVNQIWFMNDTTVSSKNTTSPVAVGGCNWYVGATTDLNLDGHNDLIWHGPGCNQVGVWFMNGTAASGGSMTVGPPVSSAFTLIGSGDFTSDMRSDLVFRDNATNDVHVWRMNGTTYINTIFRDIPSPWTPILVADMNNDGQTDFIYRRISGGTPVHAVQYTSNNAVLGGLFNITGVSGDPFAIPNAVGRFQLGTAQTAGRIADFAIEQHPPANVPGNYWFQRLNSVTNNAPSYSANTASSQFLWSENIQGPR